MMADDQLQVSLVAADREVWSGEATVVNARTAGGEIGIMADHTPVMSVLVPGVVVSTVDDGHTGSPRSTAASSRWPTTTSRSCASTPSSPTRATSTEARSELEAATATATLDATSAERAERADPDGRGGPDPASSRRRPGHLALGPAPGVGAGRRRARRGGRRMPIWEWLLDAAGARAAPRPALRRRCSSSAAGCSPATAAPSSSATASGPARAGRGWLLGLGRYSGEELEWFRIFSLSPRPKRVWHGPADLRRRRDPEGVERTVLYPDHVVIRCQSPQGDVELAMGPSSLMGFQSWLEAGPPGTDWSR